MPPKENTGGGGGRGRGGGGRGRGGGGRGGQQRAVSGRGGGYRGGRNVSQPARGGATPPYGETPPVPPLPQTVQEPAPSAPSAPAAPSAPSASPAPPAQAPVQSPKLVDEIVVRLFWYDLSLTAIFRTFPLVLGMARWARKSIFLPTITGYPISPT